MGLRADFDAYEDLHWKIYSMGAAWWARADQHERSGAPLGVSYRGGQFEMSRHELDRWKLIMDLERALWAIFSLESIVLRELMDLLSKFHGTNLPRGSIDSIRWFGSKDGKNDIANVYQCKVCKSSGPRGVDFSGLNPSGERLQQYWEFRHLWAHGHGVVTCDFKKRCPDLVTDGWFRFPDGKAWLTCQHRDDLFKGCLNVGRQILEQAIREYPELHQHLE